MPAGQLSKPRSQDNRGPDQPQLTTMYSPALSGGNLPGYPIRTEVSNGQNPGGPSMNPNFMANKSVDSQGGGQGTYYNHTVPT